MNENEVAICARDLRKTFRVYRRPMDAMLELITRQTHHIDRTALDGIDFELRRGEVVGILGKNGAGKSTLLRIIAGTLEKTSGELQVNGRITAILELGTGFRPYYTGRENIYIGGLCLGMSRSEIDSKIESIIDYSELRTVIDQPFKTYSTGMQARLTFSTAISIDPDILIIDEALSVGDARFQAKCFRRIQELRERKATILLVSHDTNTIASCCDRAMILDNGKLYADGGPKEMTALYHHLLFGRTATEESAAAAEEALNPDSPAGTNPALHKMDFPEFAAPCPATALRYGTGEATMMDWGIFRPDGSRISVIESGAPFRLSMTLACRQDIIDGSCGFAIKDRKGVVLWGMTNMSQSPMPISCDSGEHVRVQVDGVMWLAAGDYFVTLGVAHQFDGNKIDFVEDAIEFSVVGPGNIFTTSTVNLQACLNIARIPTHTGGKQ